MFASARPFALLAVLVLLSLASVLKAAGADAPAAARAWEGTLTLPTYVWEDDVNPKFWALEGGAALSTTIQGAINYPYVMQDHLSRRKVDRTYKALMLENEYLRVTCLPELGGRLHSVLDKTQNREMFHLNRVIKPGMIGMRGAWISGGVEWNSGPHGHTVTVVSPVNARVGQSPDGAAWLEVSNTEQIFRTRWTVRVTLHPGRSYLDEKIKIANPTDGMHPYYFWNCTAFPNGPGTRFVFPMSLGTDHAGREFFRWPIDKGRDLSWLKNYPTYSSVFAVNCTHDFFGAYDTVADRGIVQAANHHELSGKKAWTWGEWEFGKVAQRNLTDEESPYIEVQSGPLPTQSDYGMLGPHEQVGWQEWWYPVHGLGEGFEHATRDVAVQTIRRDGRLEVRLLSSGRFRQAACVLSRDGQTLLRKPVDLSPAAPAICTLAEKGDRPLQVTVTDKEGKALASFTTPLPIPKVEPPDPAKFKEKPDDKRTVEELYLAGRGFHRGTERRKAREYYEKALARDPGHVASLVALAAMDFEAGLYAQAIEKTARALDRDGDEGLAWFYQGASRLRQNELEEAYRCGYRAVRCPGTTALGYNLLGRVAMRWKKPAEANRFLLEAGGFVKGDPSSDRWILAMRAANGPAPLNRFLQGRLMAEPMALVPRAFVAMDRQDLSQFAREARSYLGEKDFELLEAALVFADLGLKTEASKILQAACVDAVPPDQRSFMPLYYLAAFAPDSATADRFLAQAAATHKEKVFASRAEEIPILQFAVTRNPSDWQAHFQLGCLLAHLGRVEEAVPEWQKAAELNPKHSITWRNLGLAAATKNDLPAAENLYQKAIAARPSDQTLYRDLAEILLAARRRPDAVRLLETMPVAGIRRAEITVMLARAYLDEKRDEDCIRLLESIPYFINWEGQDVMWRMFNRAHIERGSRRLEQGDAQGALADFEAALTYPANLNVGRSDKPEEAPAQFWRGRALAVLGRWDEARAAWKAGAEGADVKGAQNEFRAKCREVLAPPSSKTYRVRYLQNANVQVDGRADEPVWSQANVEKGFTFPGNPAPAPPTEFRALCDDQSLYFTFRVHDADIVVLDQLRDKQDVIFEDRAEIFFSRDDQMKEYYCLEVDPRGRAYDYRGSCYRNFDPKWICKGLETKGSTWEHGYGVEGRIPLVSFEALGFPRPRPGVKIRCGLYRAEFSHDRSGRPVEHHETIHNRGRQPPGTPPLEDWISWVDPKTEKPDFHLPASLGWLEIVE